MYWQRTGFNQALVHNLRGIDGTSRPPRSRRSISRAWPSQAATRPTSLSTAAPAGSSSTDTPGRSASPALSVASRASRRSAAPAVARPPRPGRPAGCTRTEGPGRASDGRGGGVGKASARCLRRLAGDQAGSAEAFPARGRGIGHVGIFLQAPAHVAAAGHRAAAEPGTRPSACAGRRAPRFVYPDGEGATSCRLRGNRRIPPGGP
jgi:hypothetical protein